MELVMMSKYGVDAFTDSSLWIFLDTAYERMKPNGHESRQLVVTVTEPVGSA
jgi:hypothetical protein